MTITLPKDAAFGYYYAVTFSRANATAQQDERLTTVEGATAVLVLLEAKVPNAKREVMVNEFSVKRKMYEFLPSDFDVKLSNKGNIHAAPSGSIFINKGKVQVAVLEVNTAKGNILPNSTRAFTASWNDGFPKYTEQVEDGKVKLGKDGKPMRKLQWDLGDISKLRFGKYTANLVLAYDGGQRDIPLEASLSFWVVPWRLIAAFSVAAIFVLIGLLVTGKKIFSKFRRKGKHAPKE